MKHVSKIAQPVHEYHLNKDPKKVGRWICSRCGAVMNSKDAPQFCMGGDPIGVGK